MATQTQNIDSVVAVVNVAEFNAAHGWYVALFGREADVQPDDGIAEWQLAGSAWLQLTENPERAGRGTVAIGVRDLDAELGRLRDAGFETGEVDVYPEVVKTSTVLDPEGNEIVYVEEISS